jgi:hypothetical protein
VLTILAPENTPFMVALGLLVLLALSQLIGIGVSDHAHVDLDGDHDLSIGESMASLLGLGRLPLMAWLSLMLACFALGGLTMQHILLGLMGDMLPAWPAGGIALVGALPLTGLLARPIARIWPQDETTAIDIDSLLARRGHIVIGTAARGSPARTAVKDRFGVVHHVMVEPHVDDMTFDEGEEVLLVRREGELFYAVETNGPISIGRY